MATLLNKVLISLKNFLSLLSDYTFLSSIDLLDFRNKYIKIRSGYWKIAVYRALLDYPTDEPMDDLFRRKYCAAAKNVFLNRFNECSATSIKKYFLGQVYQCFFDFKNIYYYTLDQNEGFFKTKDVVKLRRQRYFEKKAKRRFLDHKLYLESISLKESVIVPLVSTYPLPNEEPISEVTINNESYHLDDDDDPYITHNFDAEYYESESDEDPLDTFYPSSSQSLPQTESKFIELSEDLEISSIKALFSSLQIYNGQEDLISQFNGSYDALFEFISQGIDNDTLKVENGNLIRINDDNFNYHVIEKNNSDLVKNKVLVSEIGKVLVNELESLPILHDHKENRFYVGNLPNRGESSDSVPDYTPGQTFD